MNIYNISLPEKCINLSKKPIKKMRLSNDDDECKIKNITHFQLTSVKLPIDQKWHKRKYGFSLSETEVEIFMMHRLAWQNLLQSTDNYCAVLENYPSVLGCSISVLGNLNLSLNDWDVLFPFSERDVFGEKDQLEKIKLINFNLYEKKEYEPYLLGRKWGSFFYFLTRKGAKKLLQIKKIRQNVDDEILLLSWEDKLNVYCQKFPFFRYADRPQILNLSREREIYSAIMSNNVWGKGTNLKIAKNLLRTITTIANKLNINLTLEGGTLLGYIQHGRLMPWDDDIDLGIYYKDIDKLLQKIKEMETISMSKFIENWNGKAFYKIWNPNGNKIENYPYTFPFIDLWPYDILGNDIKYLNGVIYKNGASKRFTEVTFEGSQLKIPFNAINCLNSRYKTWKKMIRVYRWSHQKERNAFYPLKVMIKTQRNGRMIAPIYQLLRNHNSGE